MNEREHVEMIHDMAKAIGTTPEAVADAMDELGFSPQVFNDGELPTEEERRGGFHITEETTVEKTGTILGDAIRQRLAHDRTRTR